MRKSLGSIALIMAFAAAPLVIAPAQLQAQTHWGYQDRDQGGWGDQRAYRDGYEKGIFDRQHDRKGDADEDDYRGGDHKMYKQGYWAGYNGYGSYSNNGYGNRGYNGYNGYGNGGYSNAAQLGFQDGLREGQNDRATGHSFRPTHSEKYEDADTGYNSAYGNRQDYKNLYRSGYQRGYDQGWNGGNGRR